MNFYKKNYFLLLGVLGCVFFLPVQGMLDPQNKIGWDSQEDGCYILKLNPDNLISIACHSYDICDAISLKMTCTWMNKNCDTSGLVLDCQFRNKGFKDFAFSNAKFDSLLCLKMLRNLSCEYYRITKQLNNFQEEMLLLSPGWCARFNLITQGINNLWKIYPRAHCLSNNKKKALCLLAETQNPCIDERSKRLKAYIEYHNKEANNLDIELVKQVLLESNNFGIETSSLLSCLLKLKNDDLVHIVLDKIDKKKVCSFGFKCWERVFMELAGNRQHEALSYFGQNSLQKKEKEDFFRCHTPYILRTFLSDTKGFLYTTYTDRLSYETDRFDRTFDLLLENSCNINHEIFNDTTETILHYVCSQPDDEYSWSRVEVVKKLLQHKANINVANYSGRTPLHIACSQNNYSFPLVELLINNKANVNAADNDGNTPLHFVFSSENLKVARILLEKGANPNICDAQGCTPLNCISTITSPEMIELLCQFNADPNIVDNEGQVPLEKCILKKEAIESLHRYGACSPIATITKVKFFFGCSVFISAALWFYLAFKILKV